MVSEQLLMSISVVCIAFIIKLIIYRLLEKVSNKFKFKPFRKLLVSRIINATLITLGMLILLGIWKVGTSDLAIYITSVFTVIGVAFFAQWSHLSNITAGVILFFSNPVKVDDIIIIKEGDITIEGKIIDIGLFFVTVMAADNKKAMIANSLFMQKIVLINQQTEVKD